MTQDAELAELRDRVDCRTVLERGGWQLDASESTRAAMKYRRGAGEIIIVTREGKRWFEPLAEGSRGDVIALAQRVWTCNLGHARKALRPLAGITPPLLPASPETAKVRPLPAVAWRTLRELRPMSRAWRYLQEDRGLPAAVLEAAIGRDVVREGIGGTALFRHLLGDQVTGWEMRGPNYKGFLAGGTKGVFVMAESVPAARIVVCESAIDALSLAAIEAMPADTAYLSTAGGWGEAGRQGIELLARGARVLIAATDRGTGGEMLAGRLARLAEAGGVGFERLQADAKDWNDQLVPRQRQVSAPTLATT